MHFSTDLVRRYQRIINNVDKVSLFYFYFVYNELFYTIFFQFYLFVLDNICLLLRNIDIMCSQKRLRSACAHSQSDQNCHSLHEVAVDPWISIDGSSHTEQLQSLLYISKESFGFCCFFFLFFLNVFFFFYDKTYTQNFCKIVLNCKSEKLQPNVVEMCILNLKSVYVISQNIYIFFFMTRHILIISVCF